MSRLYALAPDHAPLYRVAPALGGGVWPAVKVYDDGDVILDVLGTTYRFRDHQLTPITPPPGMPDWAVKVLAEVMKYEDEHGHHEDGWKCFAPVLEEMPDDARLFIAATIEAWGRK